jgi:very-short-patch-repair endonuclease
MSRTWGEDRLVEQALDMIEGNLRRFMATGALGESPIEKLFHSALFARLAFFHSHWNSSIYELPPGLRLEDMGGWRDHIVLQPQVQVGAHRVDFVIHAWTKGEIRVGDSFERDSYKKVEPGWRKLVVECDGHDFHERTKEQAAHDRSRDRDLVNAGYDVFRFTGSELWRDPFGCAEQVIEWAQRGVF